MNRRTKTGRAGEGGFSLVELMVVSAIILVVGTIALPQLVASRRAMRASMIPKEVRAQLRDARQMAMSQQRAVTVQFDATLRQLKLIRHERDYVVGSSTTKVGTPVLNDANYPMTAGAVVVRTASLVASGTSTREIAYGRPPAAPTYALADTTNLTPAVAGKVNLTFQPDGSVMDATGAPANYALMFYNPDYPELTASAVSVLGAAGRVKTWRYSNDTGTYIE